MKALTTIFKSIVGGAAIEMALVFPLLLLALACFFGYAYYLWIHSTMENAVVSTARFAAINAASDARIKNEFQSNIFGVNPNTFAFTTTYSYDQGIHYETLSTIRYSPFLLNLIPSQKTVKAQITVPQAAGIFDCEQLNALMNTASGYIQRVENDSSGTVELFSLDDDGNKNLISKLEGNTSQMLYPIQNSQPLIVADAGGTCTEVVVSWWPTSNLIISQGDR